MFSTEQSGTLCFVVKDNFVFVKTKLSLTLSQLFAYSQICLQLEVLARTVLARSLIPLVSNKSLKSLLPEACITENSPEAVANSLKKLLEAHLRLEIQSELESFVKSQSLESLKEKLFAEIQ